MYVWAGGNGGGADDDCAADGYVNNVFTLAISSTSEEGDSPSYNEHCPALIATAFSSSSGFSNRRIVREHTLSKKSKIKKELIRCNKWPDVAAHDRPRERLHRPARRHVCRRTHRRRHLRSAPRTQVGPFLSNSNFIGKI